MIVKTAELINHDKTEIDQLIEIQDGKIQNIRKLLPTETPEVHRVVPGFIDMHTHGREGLSTMDPIAESYDKLSKSYLQTGTTTYIASLISASLQNFAEILAFGQTYLPINKKNAECGNCADLQGFHLEGPYLSHRNSGAQNRESIISFDEVGRDLIDKYHDIIKMITLDYQDSKAPDLVDTAKKYAIIPAAGHDTTVGSRVVDGFNQGISHITHIFCSTSSFIKGVSKGEFTKLLGTQEIALMTKGITVEIIADNHHITRSIYDFISHCKSIEDRIAVTDSLYCSNLPTGLGENYKLGDVDIILENGVAMLPDKSSLAGSISSMHDLFTRFVIDWGETPNAAVAMTSYNPAKKLGLVNRGKITSGWNADLLLMDSDYNIASIVKNGIVYGT